MDTHRTQNSTENYFSPDNQFITDSRGYSTILQDLAQGFLEVDDDTTLNDTRLLLEHRVTKIDTSDNSKVTVYTNATGETNCIEAQQIITTFSVGVLQHRGPNALTFNPPLPSWKNEAIDTMQLGVYTKIFMQWPSSEIFWPNTTQFHLYASSFRGYYPVFQSLDYEGFHPGSGILFVTVVGDQALQVDNQPFSETLAQIMQVLNHMFPDKAPLPEPTAFYYPRWSKVDWAYGSFSNVPPGMSLEMRQNLRANVGRVWFAGEHTSINWFGFLQGAYFEGKEIGERVAKRVLGDRVGGDDMRRYERLEGLTEPGAWSRENGYVVDSVGFEGARGSGDRLSRRAGAYVGEM
jgi:polyamine oxidase